MIEKQNKPVKIVYCVDKDTQDAQDYWDELDAVRDENADRTIDVATFENEKAAQAYLKQAKEYYDLVVKFEENSKNTGFYDVYNPDACEIVEIDQEHFISENEAKHYFDEDIKKIKQDLNEEETQKAR